MVSIICKSSFLSGQYASSSSVFLQFKTLVEIGRPATQMDRSNNLSEISFHALPSKSKRLSIRKQIASSFSAQLIVLLFLQNSHLQRDLASIFFRQCFCELLENSCSASKKLSLEIFRKSTKKHLWRI